MLRTEGLLWVVGAFEDAQHGIVAAHNEPLAKRRHAKTRAKVAGRTGKTHLELSAIIEQQNVARFRTDDEPVVGQPGVGADMDGAGAGDGAGDGDGAGGPAQAPRREGLQGCVEGR